MHRSSQSVSAAATAAAAAAAAAAANHALVQESVTVCFTIILYTATD